MNTIVNPSIQQDGPYYSINEEAARRAKEANSFSDYIPVLSLLTCIQFLFQLRDCVSIVRTDAAHAGAA